MIDIGVRIYSKKIPFLPEEAKKIGYLVNLVQILHDAILQSDIQAKIRVISNSDIDMAGRELVGVLPGTLFVNTHVEGGEIGMLPTVSSADMINELAMNTSYDWFCVLSSDYASKIQDVMSVLRAHEILSENFNLSNVSIIGVMTGGNHDIDLAQDMLVGKNDMSMGNISKVFPNNAFSFLPQCARFSSFTDNGAMGVIEIAGKNEPIGGNEDFYYTLEQMNENGKYAFMLINPRIDGERIGEMSGVSSKYARRDTVYKLYAERQLHEMQCQTGKGQADSQEKVIPWTGLFQDIIDRHFFFVQINAAGAPEILLTSRQRKNGISVPDLKK